MNTFKIYLIFTFCICFKLLPQIFAEAIGVNDISSYNVSIQPSTGVISKVHPAFATTSMVPPVSAREEMRKEEIADLIKNPNYKRVTEFTIASLKKYLPFFDRWKLSDPSYILDAAAHLPIYIQRFIMDIKPENFELQASFPVWFLNEYESLEKMQVSAIVKKTPEPSLLQRRTEILTLQGRATYNNVMHFTRYILSQYIYIEHLTDNDIKAAATNLPLYIQRFIMNSEQENVSLFFEISNHAISKLEFRDWTGLKDITINIRPDDDEILTKEQIPKIQKKWKDAKSPMDPKRDGNEFTTLEENMAGSILQDAPKSLLGNMNALCLIFSEPRAKALLYKILGLSEEDEEEE